MEQKTRDVGGSPNSSSAGNGNGGTVGPAADFRRFMTEHFYPQDFWVPDVGVPVPWSMAVRHNELIAVTGQVDSGRFTPSLEAQTERSLYYVRQLFEAANTPISALCRLVVHYVNNGDVDEEGYRRFLVENLEKETAVAVTMVPLPYFPHDGMLVEIDAYGIVTDDDSADDVSNAPRSIKAGRHAFVGDVSASNFRSEFGTQLRDAYANLKQSLERLQVSEADLARMGVYFRSDRVDFDQLKQALLRLLPEQLPFVVFLPVPNLFPANCLVKMDAWAINTPRETIMNPDGFPDALVGDTFYFARGVPDQSKGSGEYRSVAASQTASGLDNLTATIGKFGSTRADVLKINTFYAGTAGRDAIQENMEVRVTYFDKPGPAATGIPMPKLPEDRMIQFDVLGATPEQTPGD